MLQFFQKGQIIGEYFQYMQKLEDIVVKNTVQVKVSCELNQEVVGQNFAIIMQCLKELQRGQQDLRQGFNSLDNNYNKLSSQLNSMNNISNNQLRPIQSAHIEIPSENKKQLEEMIRQLQNKTEKHDESIISNIKDITVLQKEILELKELLKNSPQNQNTSKINPENNTGNQSLANIHKQIIANKNSIEKLNDMIKQLKNQSSKLKQNLKQITQGKGQQVFVEADKNNHQGNIDQMGSWQKELIDLRGKIAILEKKLNNQQSRIDNNSKELTNHRGRIENLMTDNEQINEEIEKINNIINSFIKDFKSYNKDSHEINTKKIDDLIKVKDYDKQIEYLQQQIEQLKRRLSQVERYNSKAQNEEKQKNDYKGSYTQTKFHSKDEDKVRELQRRLDYLEKFLHKQSTGQDSKSSHQDKLPFIKRSKLSNREKESNFNDKASQKKEILQMKNEIQNWLNNYLANMKNRDNFENLELRFQQLKNSLNKKADHEGMKKGLGFLESKINHLYLFITEPDSEDAMIVRKGVNCLSCSKKVEHLRGKIGPHVNWNNMTSTNYSPPKVGYSRNLPESGDDP